MFFDLASLAKPLVTAPLALRHLDLDADRRGQLDFRTRAEPLTVRQLLSHSAGLPPWLPYTGESLAAQLRRGCPAGMPAKLAAGTVGVSLYSDLGYRLLAELLEAEAGVPFATLGARASGLEPAPWGQAPVFVPQGPDQAWWALAEPARAFPVRAPGLPNDANARAGMRGHAGFGTDPEGLRRCLQRWLGSGAPAAMARDTAVGADGTRWGLGLQRALTGAGRFGSLLDGIPLGRGGLEVLVDDATALRPPIPDPQSPPGPPSGFWYHLGFTGPALFWRPEDGLCLAILAHRAGPQGELLDAGQLQARRWAVLEAWLDGQPKG